MAPGWLLVAALGGSVWCVRACVFIYDEGDLSAMLTNRPTKPRLRPAGGFDVAHGHSTQFNLVKRGPVYQWRVSIRSLLQKLRKQDPRIEKMLLDAQCEWSTYDCPEFNQWATLSPLAKQQALFAWIMRQKGRSGSLKNSLDILSAGLAGRLWWEHHVQPRHDDYTRAVDTGRTVYYLLGREWRTYEREWNGVITRENVHLTKRVTPYSRHFCQRVEAEVMRHAGWVLEEYREQLEQVLRRDGRI